ncbi:hypothetical protein [Tengunoibacter tsumagoiensis]|uniref:hypothetical protein n=1 Tax=Tengunoibacter tsumagoiensis TaxID=2014871 RepID=UPI000F81DC56|nr:hypothetical protein [Tengunoibacter tsumagoiensis]
MSTQKRDYLPFNLTFYTKQFLPLWNDILNGNIRPVKKLLSQTSHFSRWPYIGYPRLMSTFDFHYFIDFHSFYDRRFQSFLHHYPFLPPTSEIADLWGLFDPLFSLIETTEDVASLPGLDILHHSLFYTLCCALGPGEDVFLRLRDNVHIVRRHHFVLIGDDEISPWYEYIKHPDRIPGHWELFYSSMQAFPHDLANVLPSHLMKTLEHSTTLLQENGVNWFYPFEKINVFSKSDLSAPLLFLHGVFELCIRDALKGGLPFNFQLVTCQEDIDTTSNLLDYFLYDQLTTFKEENTMIIHSELLRQYPERMSLCLKQQEDAFLELRNRLLRRILFAAQNEWALLFLSC